jgi:hypothetical protein
MMITKSIALYDFIFLIEIYINHKSISHPATTQSKKIRFGFRICCKFVGRQKQCKPDDKVGNLEIAVSTALHHALRYVGFFSEKWYGVWALLKKQISPRMLICTDIEDSRPQCSIQLGSVRLLLCTIEKFMEQVSKSRVFPYTTDTC